MGREIFDLNYLSGVPKVINLDKNVSCLIKESSYKVKEYRPDLNVLVIHPWLVVGGAEKVLFELFSNSNQQKIKFHLLTTLIDSNPWRIAFAKITDSIFSLPHFLPMECYLNFVFKFIRSRKIDVVLVSGSEYGYRMLPEIKKAFPNLPIVDLLHIEAPEEPMDYFRFAIDYRKFLDKRIVITEYLKKAQVNKYQEKQNRIAVIHNGVDSTKFDPKKYKDKYLLHRELGINSKKKIILFVGRFAGQKQPLQFLEVAKRLRHNKDLHFVMVGEGGLKGKMDDFINFNRLKNVNIIESRVDIPEILASVAIAFFPSKREGLPMVGIESMAMEKTIIASRVEGWIDLVENGQDGILVEYGDTDGFVQAIEEVLHSNSYRRKLEKNARQKIVNNYDIKSSCEKYYQLFKELAVKSKREPINQEDKSVHKEQ